MKLGQETADDFAAALKAQEKATPRAYYKTNFSRLNRTEVSQLVKEATGVEHQDFQEMSQQLHFDGEKLREVTGLDPVDLFGAEFARSTDPNNQAMPPAIQAIQDDYAARMSRHFEEQISVMQSMQELTDKNGVLDPQLMQELTQELDALTNGSRGQMSASQLEAKIRRLASAKNRLGLTVEGVRELNAVGQQIAQRYNRGPTGALEATIGLGENLAAFSDVESMHVFGMANRDQLAQFHTMQQEAAKDSQYAATVAAGVRISQRRGLKYTDDDNGRTVERYLREVQAGPLSEEMREWEDKQMQNGTLRRSNREATGVSESRIYDMKATAMPIARLLLRPTCRTISIIA